MFSGWPASAFDFFEGLEADNSRVYFEAQRETYQSAVRGPLDDLLTELTEEFGAAKVFRINRDIRFSADKSPYKTNAAAVVWRKAGGSHYLSLDADGLYAGSGFHGMAADQLERYRAAVADGRRGSALERVVDDLIDRGYTFSEAALKTAPRGYAKDHPRIELLRRKDVYVTQHTGPKGLVRSRKALDWVADVWRGGEPLLRWMERHVGPARP